MKSGYSGQQAEGDVLGMVERGRNLDECFSAIKGNTEKHFTITQGELQNIHAWPILSPLHPYTSCLI